MCACVLQRRQDLAGEAIISNARDRAFHASFVPRMFHAGGIDFQIPGLRVLEKRGRDARRQRVRLQDDRFGVVGDQDMESPAVELPSGFARVNRAGGRFFKRGIDEAIPRADRCEDPGAKPTSLPVVDQRECEPAHPAGIHLKFLTRLTVKDGDCRRRPPKLQLEHREPVERGIRDAHALAREQLANLREPDVAVQPAPNGLTVRGADRPVVAARAPAHRM